MTEIILTALVILPSLGYLLSAWGYRRYVIQWQEEDINDEQFPCVTVIAPQRGPIDKGNIEALLAQDYTGKWEIVFVTTAEDASREQLQTYVQNGSNAQLVLAKDVVHLAEKHDIHRGQKSENLLAAIEASNPDTEIFACIDADVWPSNDWLRSLVKPFCRNDGQVGATTMARICLPGTNWPSFVQAAWTLGGIGYLLGPTVFTWGGSMAFPKVVLEKTDVVERWKGRKGSISTDDLNLSVALREIHHGICFVPGAMAMSRPPEKSQTFRDTLRFMNRQMLHSRWVQKNLFWTIFVICGSKSLALLGALCLVWWHPFLISILMTPLIEILCLWWINKTLESITPHQRLNRGCLYPAILFGGGFTQLLTGFVALRVLIMDSFEWSGVTYSYRKVLGYSEDRSWRAVSHS